MRRREFIVGLGSAATWQLAARAQQGDRMRRVGILVGRTDNTQVIPPYIGVFRDGLSKLGWVEGATCGLICGSVAMMPTVSASTRRSW